MAAFPPPGGAAIQEDGAANAAVHSGRRRRRSGGILRLAMVQHALQQQCWWQQRREPGRLSALGAARGAVMCGSLLVLWTFCIINCSCLQYCVWQLVVAVCKSAWHLSNPNPYDCLCPQTQHLMPANGPTHDTPAYTHIHVQYPMLPDVECPTMSPSSGAFAATAESSLQ